MTRLQYPLNWPPGWPRQARTRAAGKFSTGTIGYRRDISLHEAVERVNYELFRLGVDPGNCIVSTNKETKRDSREPIDSGAAVYWETHSGAMVIAVDRYIRVADNVAAIAATLEAMRAIERHGGAQILQRAFTGFEALPAPASCWAILKISPLADRDTIESAFRRLAREHHPDVGGDNGTMSTLNQARADALEKLAQRPPR